MQWRGAALRHNIGLCLCFVFVFVYDNWRGGKRAVTRHRPRAEPQYWSLRGEEGEFSPGSIFSTRNAIHNIALQTGLGLFWKGPRVKTPIFWCPGTSFMWIIRAAAAFLRSNWFQWQGTIFSLDRNLEEKEGLWKNDEKSMSVKLWLKVFVKIIISKLFALFLLLGGGELRMSRCYFHLNNI